MSLREAVERAGSLDALLPLLVQGLILARATHFLEWPSGAPIKLPSLDIGPIWWGTVRTIDPDTGRVCFATDFFEVMAIGVALERAAVEATWPAAVAVRHPGGKPPDHAWEDAARHVDSWVKDHGPLPRHKSGKQSGRPLVARAVELMTEYFDNNEPATPEPESIYRWIRDNPHPDWWKPN